MQDVCYDSGSISGTIYILRLEFFNRRTTQYRWIPFTIHDRYISYVRVRVDHQGDHCVERITFMKYTYAAMCRTASVKTLAFTTCILTVPYHAYLGRQMLRSPVVPFLVLIPEQNKSRSYYTSHHRIGYYLS